MLNVLYLDGVGPFGGASRSLFEAVKVLSGKSVNAYFLVARGTASDFYSTVAKDIMTTVGLTRFDNTRYSYYRKLRWIVLLREVFHIPFMFLSLRKAKKKWGNSIDLIHVNEITEIIPGLLAKWMFKVPLVIHVRSLQREDEKSIRCKYINWALLKYADAIIAINENTRATLPKDMNVDVVQNSFTSQPSKNPDLSMLQKLNALRSHTVKIGFVGNLQVSKGLYDLLEAARIVLSKNKNVDFVIVGGDANRFVGFKQWVLELLGLAQDVRKNLTEKIASYELQSSFHLLGATTDIQPVYEMIDVVCFPSHYDAPGRPVFEAAFSAVPSIVCVTHPKSDTLIDYETGIAIPAKDPEKLAAAILFFVENPKEIVRMGKCAAKLAEENFSPACNAARLLTIYNRISKDGDSGE